ncbi:hypothetical protein [Leifsonia sp. fls2-241-R2A-40a]|uniref:hypothetical protein n=1 Tax=Leifsonia sp. fls2-241-R2A-40a TaxID=3040290 RepID=UPI00254A6C18|nr:hypothetical protein [Leifsonia sp. fls2-241-R2A-40a]
MSVEWSPVGNAHAIEWVMQTAPGQQPYALIRLLQMGDLSRPDEFYRVVTWAPTSEGRRLIGYCPTLEAGAQLAWDYYSALSNLRHHYAARRADMSKIDELSGDPAALVAFFRQHRGETPTGRHTMTAGPPDAGRAEDAALRDASNRAIDGLLAQLEAGAPKSSIVAGIRAVRSVQARAHVDGSAAAVTRQITGLAGRLRGREPVDAAEALGNPRDLPVDAVVSYDTMREAANRLAAWHNARRTDDDEAADLVSSTWKRAEAVDHEDDDEVLLARERFARELRCLQGAE